MHRKSIWHNFEDRTDPTLLCSACREAPTPDLLLNAKDANHPWYLIKELPVPSLSTPDLFYPQFVVCSLTGANGECKRCKSTFAVWLRSSLCLPWKEAPGPSTFFTLLLGEGPQLRGTDWHQIVFLGMFWHRRIKCGFFSGTQLPNVNVCILAQRSLFTNIRRIQLIHTFTFSNIPVYWLFSPFGHKGLHSEYLHSGHGSGTFCSSLGHFSASRLLTPRLQGGWKNVHTSYLSQPSQPLAV